MITVSQALSPLPAGLKRIIEFLDRQDGEHLFNTEEIAAEVGYRSGRHVGYFVSHPALADYTICADHRRWFGSRAAIAALRREYAKTNQGATAEQTELGDGPATGRSKGRTAQRG